MTRFLSAQDDTSQDLWREVKSTIRSLENKTGVLIFDDTIQEKAWTDESELMGWHYAPCSGRMIRGFNLLNALYPCNGTSFPVAFELGSVDILPPPYRSQSRVAAKASIPMKLTAFFS
jgi:hypothetical protein